MKTLPILLTLGLALAFAVPTARSQNAEPISPSSAQASLSPAEATDSMQRMDTMADSVTKMSEMCQTMMRKEMEPAPYKMAAGATIGILLLLALILFVILEVQWIIYWSRLLKAQKDRPPVST